jgi:hypothetical protein
MEIELKRGEYANFLARVYRLEEAIGQYLFLKWCNDTRTKIRYKKEDKKYTPLVDARDIGEDDINKKLEDNFEDLAYRIRRRKPSRHPGVNKLTEFIKSHYGYDPEENKYKYAIKINTKTYHALVKHLYGENSKECKLYENIQKIYKKDDKNLRHTTIVAHGFKGVNKDMINEMLAKNEINKDIEEFFTEDIKNKFYKKIIGEDVEDNIFDKINNEIIEYLNNI